VSDPGDITGILAHAEAEAKNKEKSAPKPKEVPTAQKKPAIAPAAGGEKKPQQGRVF